VAATSIAILDRLENDSSLRERLWSNTEHFRRRMTAAGFTLAGANAPIIPVMLGDARVAAEMAERLLDQGVYVVAFSYPVVPAGKARIRTQVSAAHTVEMLDCAVEAFTAVARAMKVI
jgi:glycine C-acetyltransferase